MLALLAPYIAAFAALSLAWLAVLVTAARARMAPLPEVNDDLEFEEEAADYERWYFVPSLMIRCLGCSALTYASPPGRVTKEAKTVCSDCRPRFRLA